MKNLWRSLNLNVKIILCEVGVLIVILCFGMLFRAVELGML